MILSVLFPPKMKTKKQRKLMTTLKQKLKQGLEKRIYNEDEFIDEVLNFQKDILLNRLKELYKFAVQNEESEFYIGRLENYQSVRAFCLDTQLVSFNDIELMENEVNTEINNQAIQDSVDLDSWGK